jgi:hypothetical protein
VRKITLILDRRLRSAIQKSPSDQFRNRKQAAKLAPGSVRRADSETIALPPVIAHELNFVADDPGCLERSMG